AERAWLLGKNLILCVLLVPGDVGNTKKLAAWLRAFNPIHTSLQCLDELLRVFSSDQSQRTLKQDECSKQVAIACEEHGPRLGQLCLYVREGLCERAVR